MYKVDGKAITTALTKVLDVTSIGDTTSNESVRIDFSKVGLTFYAQNSAGTYEYKLECAPSAKPKVKTGIITASSLLSYTKGRSTVTLVPEEEHLVVTSKGLKATLFYVGSTYDVDIDRPEEVVGVDKVAEFVDFALSRCSGMKDRVEQKSNIYANFTTARDEKLFTVGDSHHVLLVTDTSKFKRSSDITMTTNNMRRVFGIGGSLALLPTRIVAFNDTEYLSLNATTVGDAIRTESVKQLLEDIGSSAKPAEYNAVDLMNTVSALAVNIDNDTPISLSINEGKLALTVKTGASTATMFVEPSAKNKVKAKVYVNIYQLLDVLSAMKTGVVRVFLAENMVMLQQDYTSNKLEGTVTGLVSVVASKD